MVGDLKDQKLTVLVTEADMHKLRELAEDEEESASLVIRMLIRREHAARFGATKKAKTKK